MPKRTPNPKPRKPDSIKHWATTIRFSRESEEVTTLRRKTTDALKAVKAIQLPQAEATINAGVKARSEYLLKLHFDRTLKQVGKALKSDRGIKAVKQALKENMATNENVERYARRIAANRALHTALTLHGNANLDNLAQLLHPKGASHKIFTNRVDELLKHELEATRRKIACWQKQ